MEKFRLFGDDREVPPHPKKEPLFDPPPDGDNILAELGGSEDFGKRTITLFNGEKAELFFIDGLVDSFQISQNVVLPLMRGTGETPLRRRDTVSEVLERTAGNLSARRCETLSQALRDILDGWTVLCIKGKSCAVSFEAKGGEKRSVEEPEVENVVKGAKDAFVENIRVNTSLVRRKLRNKDLRIISRRAGRQSGTRLAVVYIEGLTDDALVREVSSRLDSIDTDGLLTPASLEEHLVPEALETLFPLLSYTDLSDVFSGGIMEGRVGVLCDGLPLGYLLPATAETNMRAPEDSGNNHTVASVIRILRYVALFVTLVLPGFYVAVAAFHQEMIPYRLARAIAQSKADVPFSTTVEVIGMLVAFEILQEAGLRLPKSVGQTVSIVGALIVGQSAVEAKIFSPVVVIVVAAAGVAGYTVPNQDFSSAVRIWRFVIALSAALLGMLGVAAACMMLVYHLCSIESFGAAYMSAGDGGVTRRPFIKQKLRPKVLKTKNVRREG